MRWGASEMDMRSARCCWLKRRMRSWTMGLSHVVWTMIEVCDCEHAGCTGMS
jgi:hypothetical protein